METIADATSDLANAPPEWVGDLDEDTLASARESEPPRVTIPHEIVVHPGSFTVSTLSVVMVLFLTAFTMMALAAAGLVAGMGMGLAMLSLLF